MPPSLGMVTQNQRVSQLAAWLRVMLVKGRLSSKHQEISMSLHLSDFTNLRVGAGTVVTASEIRAREMRGSSHEASPLKNTGQSTKSSQDPSSQSHPCMENLATCLLLNQVSTVTPDPWGPNSPSQKAETK